MRVWATPSRCVYRGSYGGKSYMRDDIDENKLLKKRPSRREGTVADSDVRAAMLGVDVGELGRRT